MFNKSNNKAVNTDSSLFAINVLKMSSAPFLTQIISFILMPIIARLYSPSIFGIFNIFGSVVGPLTAFSNMGYHQAIVLPKKNQNAISLVYGNILITTLLFIITLLFFSLISESIWYDLQIDSIKSFWLLVPISIFIHGINASFLGWNQRTTNYNTIVVSRILDSTVNKALLIILGFVGYATTGSLISGALIGAAAMTLLQIVPFLKKGYSYPSFKEIISVFIKYKKFPLFIMSSDLVYRITSSAIIIFLVSYFSESVAGYYGMAIMMAGVPTVLIGTSIGEVFYQKAAKEKNVIKSNEIYIQLFSKLVKLSIFSFLLLAILSNELFTIFLGAKWQETGNYTRILCFQMFIAFIMSPILSLSQIYNKQQYLLIAQILILIMSLVAITIGGSLNNINIAIALLSFFNGCITLIFGLLIFYVTDVSIKKIVNIIIKYLVYCLPFALPLVIIKSFYSYSNIGILLMGFFCFMIYYGILLKTDRDLLLLFKNTITKLRLFKL